MPPTLRAGSESRPSASAGTPEEEALERLQQVGDALRGVGHRERGRALAHRLQTIGRADERDDALRERRRRERALRQHFGAAGALDEPRVRGLLVAARARQRDVERRDAELAALV